MVRLHRNDEKFFLRSFEAAQKEAIFARDWRSTISIKFRRAHGTELEKDNIERESPIFLF